MTMSRIVFLMYHELELPDRSLCQSDPGYVRYVLRVSSFREQMERLKHIGWHGSSVSEALTFPTTPKVAITFDDGAETDLLAAAPILQELGFGATFYITYRFLDTPGFLSKLQLKQLSDLGLEIGCHSMTHAYLSDLDDTHLHHEIVEPKAYLEQIIGRPVEHFSCPGGRYSPRVAAIAREAGYRTVTTSRTHANTRVTDPFALGRVAIIRDTSLYDFESLCQGHGLWQMSLRTGVRQSAQRILGNSFYDWVRTQILDHNEPRSGIAREG